MLRLSNWGEPGAHLAGAIESLMRQADAPLKRARIVAVETASQTCVDAANMSWVQTINRISNDKPGFQAESE